MKKLLLFCGLLYSINIMAVTSVMFFASNNTGQINADEAYTRLIGNDQYNLTGSITQIMQERRVQQGKFDNVIGMYKNYADNTEVFSTSPNQDIAEPEVEFIAKKLANELKQETIAVFIPNETAKTIGEISVTFRPGREPNFRTAMIDLKRRLPAPYTEAFSMYLDPTYSGISQKKVAKIAWLGTKLNIERVKRAYPYARVDSKNGEAFLIDQNGIKIPL